MNNLQSAWTGHRDFAIWLVNQVQPEVTVDLGVDYGFSLFALAAPRVGTVYGIDSFEYDQHSGAHPDNYQVVMDFKERHGLHNVEVIKGWFSDVAKIWTQPIDILHIDGLHTTAAITEDWNSWAHRVTENGVIIMHDISAFEEVRAFFNSIDMPKAHFTHSAGLGIVTRNQKLLNAISFAWPTCRVGNA